MKYNEPGHVCPDTKRTCITVREAYAMPDSPDCTFFVYSPNAADMGMECWWLVDGLDASTDGTRYEIDFPTRRSWNVSPDYPVYLQPLRGTQHG